MRLVLTLPRLALHSPPPPDFHHLSINTHCAQAKFSSLHSHLQQWRMSAEVIYTELIWWRFSKPSHTSFLPLCLPLLSLSVSSCIAVSPSPLSSVHLPCVWWCLRCHAIPPSSLPSLPSYASITCSLERGWWSDGPPWLCSKNNRANFPPVRRRFHTNLSRTAQLGLSEREGEKNKVDKKSKARKRKM